MSEKLSTIISVARKAEYKAAYDRLVARAVGRKHEKGVHERHHIVPRSLGGSNEKSNIVCLTYREHFLAHWLLIKILTGDDLKKMQHALFRITHKSNTLDSRIISGWQYETARKAKAIAISGESHPMHGKKHTKESVDKMIIKNHMRGKYGELHHLYGKTHKESTKALMSELRKNRQSGEDHPLAKAVIEATTNKIFVTSQDAAEYFNLSKSTIHYCLKLDRPYFKRALVFKYLDSGNGLEIANNLLRKKRLMETETCLHSI